MTTPSDQDVASACRWLDKHINVVHIHARPGQTVQESLLALARSHGWTPSPPAPVFTEAEFAAIRAGLSEAAQALHEVYRRTLDRADLSAAQDADAILNRIRGGR